MERYFIVEEFFGIRVYDSVQKKEFYYTNEEKEKIMSMLKNNFTLISHQRESKMSAPLKISMNLTKKCNLRCKQCFSDSGEIQKEELSTEDLYKLFDDMQESGTFFICLGGGEPLTRPDLLDILSYGKKKQLAISIVSNGLLLTRELIDKLNEMNLDTFWISLDGLEKNHENLRGKGTYQKAIDALLLLKDFYKGKTALRMSLNKSNISEYKDIIKVAEDVGVDLVRFTPILDFGRAKNEDILINQEQYIAFLSEIKDIKSNVEIVYPNKPTPNKIWIGKNGFGCHCGKEAVWIDEIGNYSPCIFWGEKFILGNIKETKYIDLWDMSLKAAEIEGNEICKTCSNYKDCRGGCRVRSLWEYGNLNEVDPMCPLKKAKQLQ